MTEPGGTANIEAVTDLHRELAGTPVRADAAVQAADAAARAAGVQVREISALTELEAVYRLYADIWRPDPKNPPVTSELLRAFSKAGNYVAGAFDGDVLVGACVGFFGAPADEALHSHIAGVSGAARGRNVGFALKVHQRAWSLLRGVSAVAWTFDPLVRRNAYFNLVKLAARPDGVPHQLLRRHARHDQRRRRQRSAAGALVARGSVGRGRVRRLDDGRRRRGRAQRPVR